MSNKESISSQKSVYCLIPCFIFHLSSMKSPMILGRSIDFLLILAEQGSYHSSTRIYHSSQGSIQDNHKRSPTDLHTNQVLSKQPGPPESNPPTTHLHVL